MSEVKTDAAAIVNGALELAPDDKPLAPLTWVDEHNMYYRDDYVYTREMLASARRGVSEGAIAGGGIASSLPVGGSRR